MEHLGVEDESKEGDKGRRTDCRLDIESMGNERGRSGVRDLQRATPPSAKTVTLFLRAFSSVVRFSANFSANFLSQAKNLRTLIA